MQTLTETRQQGTEFIWRRLEEPPELFGMPLDFHPWWWLVIAVPVVLLALALIYWMYTRDSKAVGPFWGVFLAGVRTLALIAIFFIWLLPAMRQVERTEQRSRVLMIYDVSASVQGSDEPPSDQPGQVRKSRIELLQEMMLLPPKPTTAAPTAAPTGTSPETPAETAKADFISRLTEKNPLFCYRFGEVLDGNVWTVSKEQPLNPAGWSRKLQPSAQATLAHPIPNEITQEFSRVAPMLVGLEGMDEAERERRQKEIADSLERTLAERAATRERLLNRTNLGTALLDVLRKEKGNMVQGIILFSDGRTNAGSTQMLNEAVNAAREARIPLFTVGIGVHRDIPNLRLVDVLAPNWVQPEDEFPIRVAVEGENLPRGQSANVILTVEKPGQPPKDETQQVVLAPTTARLANGAAEFRITNPQKLKGDWKFRARVEPIKGERTRADNLAEEPAIVKVEERKLSVLLFASGPSHDYQFLRSLLVREKDKFDVSIYLQSAASGTVQDVDAKRLLDQFPSELRDRDEEPNNLGRYDVVIALDPDWREVPPSNRENLLRWVERFGGGMIVVAGPIHTFVLARDRDLTNIRTLYPVMLDDTATSFTIMDRSSKEPWGLNFGGTASQKTFLDLTDAGDKTRILDGWDEYFFDYDPKNPIGPKPPRDAAGNADRPALRGFFSFFPLKEVKPGAEIIARFSDPGRDSLTPRGERQPYFVQHSVGKGPVFYIGSMESYRLRAYSEKFHERFWTKTIRQMGKRGSPRGLLVVGSRYGEGDTVDVEAQLYDAEMKPFKPDAKAKVLLRVLPPPEITDTPKAWNDGLEMKADAGRPGWFNFRFPVKRSGKYGLELKIPGSAEKLAGKFRVETTDPERDITRPDFALLHRMASEVKAPRDKSKSGVEIALADESRRPAFEQTMSQNRTHVKALVKEAPPGSMNVTPENEADRLFFDLESAHWIPDCLDGNSMQSLSIGKTSDIWDKGWNVFANLQNPDDATGPPWALVLVVALLSVEWLTRKLLKLA